MIIDTWKYIKETNKYVCCLNSEAFSYIQSIWYLYRCYTRAVLDCLLLDVDYNKYLIKLQNSYCKKLTMTYLINTEIHQKLKLDTNLNWKISFEDGELYINVL